VYPDTKKTALAMGAVFVSIFQKIVPKDLDFG
jgi:hypothetical protein